MNEQLKVYGGSEVQDGKSIRVIIAARSRAEAAKIVGWSGYSFNRYWDETGNNEECKWARANPRIRLVHPDW